MMLIWTVNDDGIEYFLDLWVISSLLVCGTADIFARNHYQNDYHERA